MKRKLDIETIIKHLDITATMYENAVNKYHAIADYLSTQGIEADFYPQGSFRLGTVVRPFKNGRDADYDLDVICEISEEKILTDPQTVKNSVGNALKLNKIYNDRLLPEEDRCWTLQYALVDGEIGFSLDVVPSVHQDELTINNLIVQGVEEAYANGAIAITEKKPTGKYKWQASNPQGYGAWFDSINEKFLNASREEIRNNIFNENRALYEAVEEVPS